MNLSLPIILLTYYSISIPPFSTIFNNNSSAKLFTFSSYEFECVFITSTKLSEHIINMLAN